MPSKLARSTGKTYREILLPKWDDVRQVAMQMDGWVFRGQRDARWALTTSFERGAQRRRLDTMHWRRMERKVIREFQRRAHQYGDEGVRDGDLLEWVALLQHHGGPTRLLDFSHSFYVGAFFALVDADPEAEAALWAIPGPASRPKTSPVRPSL